MISVPAGVRGPVLVVPGPLLLSGVTAGPTLAAHRQWWPDPGRVSASRLLGLLESVAVPGRGGAAFPFARKVSAAVRSGRRRELVVNAAESEPGSAKDSALLVSAPHLVLDGAELVAGALGVNTVRLVVPGARPTVRRALETALEERRGRFEIYQTTSGFVGGQESAVLQLIEGRPNLPVTSWQPAALRGLRGRPTVVSNAETFAQVAVLRQVGPDEYRRFGTGSEPGTTLLTVAGDTAEATVLEVEHGASLGGVLATCGFGAPVAVLAGGYHGGWLDAGQVQSLTVSRQALATAGGSLGAGVLLPLAPGQCPVQRTAGILDHLARQGAQQCGPCRFGLPALAAELVRLGDPAQAFDPAGPTGVDPASLSATATASVERLVQLADLVRGRGACAHPDGAVRLVGSLVRAFPDDLDAHRRGGCLARPDVVPTASWFGSDRLVPR